MKTNELKELGAEELEAKIAEVRKELDDLKLKLASKVDVAGAAPSSGTAASSATPPS